MDHFQNLVLEKDAEQDFRLVFVLKKKRFETDIKCHHNLDIIFKTILNNKHGSILLENIDQVI